MQFPVASTCSTCGKDELYALAATVEMINESDRENERITELRGAMLPKLMSGEIEVSQVELAGMERTGHRASEGFVKVAPARPLL